MLLVDTNRFGVGVYFHLRILKCQKPGEPFFRRNIDFTLRGFQLMTQLSTTVQHEGMHPPLDHLLQRRARPRKQL